MPGLNTLVLASWSVGRENSGQGDVGAHVSQEERRRRASLEDRPVGKASGAASIATVIRGSKTGEQERMTVGGRE